jgi:hypothetical protein
MNQQDHFEGKEQTEPLADLSVTDEQSEQTKGGAEAHSVVAFGGFSGGIRVGGS